jgi:hypothetical protein
MLRTFLALVAVAIGAAAAFWVWPLLRYEVFPPAEVRFEDFEKSVFSQHGEDGVLEKLFEVIEPTSFYAVEFGAADGATISNTRNLILNHDWGALLIEPLRCASA